MITTSCRLNGNSLHAVAKKFLSGNDNFAFEAVEANYDFVGNEYHSTVERCLIQRREGSEEVGGIIVIPESRLKEFGSAEFNMSEDSLLFKAGNVLVSYRGGEITSLSWCPNERDVKRVAKEYTFWFNVSEDAILLSYPLDRGQRSPSCVFKIDLDLDFEVVCITRHLKDVHISGKEVKPDGTIVWL